MDNTSALAYVTKMGGTRSTRLTEVARQIWDWCLQRQITLSASHLPGLENQVADQESRQVQTSAEGKLHKEMFNLICACLGPCAVDLFATRLNHQLKNYVSWRPDPGAMETNAFHISWTGLKGYAFPPFSLIRQMSSESENRAEYGSDSGTAMAEPDMVSDAARVNDRVSTTPTEAEGHTEGLQRPAPPTGMSQQTTTSRLESLRRQHSTTGVSKETSELLLAGWSKGTNTAYQSGWKRWSSWCERREIDSIRCGIQCFLDFITSLFKEGLQYRSINLIRSAVSTTHLPVDGTPIGQHPLVKQLFKGVYNSRPPQPRYTHTWDVSAVLNHIAHLGNNRDLSLKQLSFKLLMLMSLTSASRVSELQALDLRFRRYTTDGVVFKLASLTKKRQAGASLKERYFASFVDNDKLCVVQCLKQYEAVTNQFRTIVPEKAAPLFLSHIKPHKPVTTQCLAHWIKDLLKEAGVNTDVFKAHSVRGATTSAALDKGVLISDILSTADWSRESTFRNFYYRPSTANTFAQRVLGSN